MLIKIDHLSYSCDETFDYKMFLNKGFELDFYEEQLVNIDCKKALLKYESQYHSIYMLSKEGSVPIEITMYDCVDNIDTGMKLKDNVLEWEVRNVEITEEFLMALGARKGNDNQLTLKGFFDKTPLEIKLTKKVDIETQSFLDINGFSSLGLVVDNVNRELDKLQKNGYYVTGVNEIEVNKKRMEIGFVVGLNNEIVELISVRKS